MLTKVYNRATSCFDVIFAPLAEYPSLAEWANGVYLPPVITDCERERVRAALDAAIKHGASYALVGNLGHIPLIEGTGLTPIGDFRLNITNRGAREAYAKLGIEDTLLSAELTLPMARDVGGGAIVYGRIPLMLTERCFMKENFGCESCSDSALTDRRGARFPIIREFEHRNLILNSAVTYMGDRRGELEGAGILHRHAIFSVESEGEADAAIDSLIRGTPLAGSLQIRRMGRREGERSKPADKRSPAAQERGGQKKGYAPQKRKFNKNGR